MPIKRLPANPNLERLKSEARRVLRLCETGDLRASQRVREFHPRFSKASDFEIRDAKLSWSDALFVIAREHGFASWARLRERILSGSAASSSDNYVARITDPVFRAAVVHIENGEIDALRDLLDANPDLVTRHAHFEGENYFRHPSLLAFIADNPVRTESLPPNIVDIAKLFLDRGAGKTRSDVNETLQLVASGRVAREAGVQDALIALLISAGADPDAAIIAAIAHGEFAAARTLLKCGASLTLPVAAALGDTDHAIRLLEAAQPGERHLALALAAQHGRCEVLKRLVEAGEDPDRYNPVGAHAHSTPLHQAALNGHECAVRILLQYGADRLRKDLIWNGTPLDWARHAGNESVVELLEKGLV